MTERDWSARIERILPTLFGGLLDAAVVGRRRNAETETPNVRMADFARFVVAAEPALPWPGGAFLAAYQRNRGQAVAALAEGDLVATAVKNFVASRPDEWQGLGPWRGDRGARCSRRAPWLAVSLTRASLGPFAQDGH
jgi:hypothetical protein